MDIRRFAVITAVAATTVTGIGPAYARNTAFQAIGKDFATGRIDKAQATEYRLYAALAPDRLPASYRRIETSRPVRHSSIELASLKRDFAVLPKAVQDEFSYFLTRPTLPSERVLETAHFKIHYTFTGSNRVTAAFLNAVGTAAEFVRSTEVDGLGYDAPPVDDAGDSKYDIYLLNMSDAYSDLYYGLTYMEYVDGSGYMELDNDYSESDYATKGTTAMQVTLAHEFFHAIQYGYAGFSVSSANAWWMEINSVWMEDMVYDDADDYLQYLEGYWGWFSWPHVSLMTYDGWHEYGSCIFNHYLSRKYGNDMIKAIWEAGRSASSALQAINDGLATVGSSMDVEVSEFAVWNLFTDSRADTAVYYAEGHLYPEIFIDSSVMYSDAAAGLPGILPQGTPPTMEIYGMAYAALGNVSSLDNGIILFMGSADDAWSVPVVSERTDGSFTWVRLEPDDGGTGLVDVGDPGGLRSLYPVFVRRAAGGTGTFQYSTGVEIDSVGITAAPAGTLNVTGSVTLTAYAYDSSATRLGAVNVVWALEPAGAGDLDDNTGITAVFTPTDTGWVRITATFNDSLGATFVQYVRPQPADKMFGSVFPNPYMPARHAAGAAFSLQLDDMSTDLQVYLYDAYGRLVRELRPDGHVPVPAGVYRTVSALDEYGLVWDGTNNAGKPVASGTYYYRLRAVMLSGDEEFTGLKLISVVR